MKILITPGQRAADFDLVRVHQGTTWGNPRTWEAPTIHWSSIAPTELQQAQDFRDQLTAAIRIAKKWDKETGKESRT